MKNLELAFQKLGEKPTDGGAPESKGSSSSTTISSPRTRSEKATCEYVLTHVAGCIAYLEWRASRRGSAVHYGADTFVIRDGFMRAQTLYSRLADRDA